MFQPGIPPAPEKQQEPWQQQSHMSFSHSPAATTEPQQGNLPLTPASEQNDNDANKPAINRDDGDSDTATSPKQNRLRKACDSCSLRKVKCDNEQPCRACRSLNIPCTSRRPTRRRGPPNRLAESLRRSYRDNTSISSHDDIASPNQPHASIIPTSPFRPALSIESIGHVDLVRALVDDYFTFVHPVQPFPHEPSYRKDLAERRDVYDPSFLALTAAMIGSLTAAFPRRPRKRLKSLGKGDLFQNSVNFVRHCQKITSEARGSGYLERPTLNANDAATSYLLFTMCAHTLSWRNASLYAGECLTIVRSLLAIASDDTQTLPKPTGEEGEGKRIETINYVERELIRRIYWIVFVTVRSGVPFGVTLADLHVRPPTPSQGHPPLPLEIDDHYIHHSLIHPQPTNILSKMTGFNANCRIYLTHDPLIALESSYGIDFIYNWERQAAILQNCVEQVKRCFDKLPEQLLVWRGAESRSPSSGSFTLYAQPNSRPSTPGSEQPQQHGATDGHIGAYEIQKANIHASYLSSRSYFVEKFWDLVVLRGVDARIEADIRRERESICDDLLDVLSSIRRINMEPNSVAFCMKIRQIASTLLPSARSAQTEGGGATLQHDGRAANYLRSFLEILMTLEKCSVGADTGGNGASKRDEQDQDDEDDENEEEELRQWASLRERQREFCNGEAREANTRKQR